MNPREQIQRGIEEAEAAYRNSNRLLCKSDWLRRRYRVKPNAVAKGSRSYVSPVKYTHRCDLYAIDDCVRIRHRKLPALKGRRCACGKPALYRLNWDLSGWSFYCEDCMAPDAS